MSKSRLLTGLLAGIVTGFAVCGMASADGGQLPSTYDPTLAWLLLTGGLAFLVPVGLTLVASGGLSEERAAPTALMSLAAMGLAVIGYWASGFAFQFGGIGLVNPLPGAESLIWEWSALDVSWGPGWGMLGLKGFFLDGQAYGPAVYALVLSQLALVTTAVLIPLLTLRQRVKTWVLVLSALLLSAVVYPVLGNWTWGGGWLANLGRNLDVGHGFVDFAGAGLVHVLGTTAALAGILVFGPRATGVEGEEKSSGFWERTFPLSGTDRRYAEMPPVHLPLLALTGAIIALVGWLAWLNASPLHLSSDLSPALAAINLLMAAAGSTLIAVLYCWFTTSEFNPLMAARGTIAGLIAISAAAPFVAPRSALVVGAVAGLLLPLGIYLVERVLRLDDPTAVVATHGISGAWGLLAVGLFADGRYGAGWNAVGADQYLDVTGQGVTGYLAATGFQPDWPGQINAQLVGLAATVAVTFVLTFVLFTLCHEAIKAWESTGLELGPVPELAANPDGVEEEIEVEEGNRE